MNNTGILGNYANLKPIFDAAQTDEFLRKIGLWTEAQLEAHFAHGGMYGEALLFTDVPINGKSCVVEVLVSQHKGDSFVTVYEGHQAFNSRTEYLAAREELIVCLEDIKDASPGMLGIRCPGRKRAVTLREISLLQLVELLQKSVNKFHGK